MIVIPARNRVTCRLVDVVTDSAAVFNAAVRGADGALIPWSLRAVSPTAYAAAASSGVLPAGELVGCSAVVDGGSGVTGRIFGRMDIEVGGGGSAVVALCVMRGAFNGQRLFGLPGMAPLVGLATNGCPHSYQITQPAAGAVAVMTTAQWGMTRVDGVSFRLVTDANVATRYTYVELQLATGRLLRFHGAYAHTAGVTMDYSFGVGGLRDGSIGNYRQEVMGAFAFPTSGVLRIGAYNLQVGDQFSLATVSGPLWFEL